MELIVAAMVRDRFLAPKELRDDRDTFFEPGRAGCQVAERVAKHHVLTFRPARTYPKDHAPRAEGIQRYRLVGEDDQIAEREGCDQRSGLSVPLVLRSGLYFTLQGLH